MVVLLWGGGGPSGPTGRGLDCSGLTQYAIYQATNGRIILPHFTDYQPGRAPPQSQRLPMGVPGRSSPRTVPGAWLLIAAGRRLAGARSGRW